MDPHQLLQPIDFLALEIDSPLATGAGLEVSDRHRMLGAGLGTAAISGCLWAAVKCWHGATSNGAHGVARLGTRRKAWSLRSGRGGCRVYGREVSSVASIEARGTEAWAAAGPTIDDCGARHHSGPRRDKRMPPQRSAVRIGALENEERGMSRRAKGRQPRTVPGGGLGFLSDPTTHPPAPPRSYHDRSAAKVRSVAGFVLRAIAVSLNHDRLPVARVSQAASLAEISPRSAPLA